MNRSNAMRTSIAAEGLTEANIYFLHSGKCKSSPVARTKRKCTPKRVLFLYWLIFTQQFDTIYSTNWNLTKECSLCLNYLKKLFGLSGKISPHVPASQKHMLQLLNIANQMGIPIISSAIMKLKLRESYMKYAASVLLFTVDVMSLSVGRNNKPLSYKFQSRKCKSSPVARTKYKREAFASFLFMQMNACGFTGIHTSIGAPICSA